MNEQKINITENQIDRNESSVNVGAEVMPNEVLAGESFIGKFWLRKNNENQEPMFVYVESYSTSWQSYICHKLNTGEQVFSNGKDLLPVNYKQYRYMYGKHLYKQALARLRYAKQIINESQREA